MTRHLPYRLCAASAVLVTLAAGALVAATPASARSTRRSGYVLANAHIIGETPVQQGIYVDRHAYAAPTLARLMAADARELRRIGFNIRYRGYGTPKAAEGRIRVTSGTAGCVGDGGQSGAVTFPRWEYLPSGQAYMYDARVVVCPSFARRYPSELPALLKHEMGHVMGLAHLNSRYRGRYQIMRWRLTAGITDYQAGDLAGLRALARGTKVVKTLIAPVGRLEKAAWSPYGGQMRVQLVGWAGLRFFPRARVKITVTRDGKRVLSTTARASTPTASKSLHLRGGHGFTLNAGLAVAGTHKYCVQATSPLNRHSTVSLGCAVFTM